MSMIWLQSLVVFILIYGIILFIFGVRGFSDFMHFSSRLNRKRNRLLAIAYLILPPFILAWVVEFITAFWGFFSHPVTLWVIGIAAAASVLIPLVKRIPWYQLYRQAVQRIKEVVTPLQFFLWTFLILLSVTLTWILVGEFWIIDGFTVAAGLALYLQMAGIYFLGSWYKRVQIEKQRKQGLKYVSSPHFEIKQIHVYIFFSLNFITVLITWLLIGDFWFFNKLVVVTATVLFVIMSIAWGFGAIIWKKYLKPMSESDSNIQQLFTTLKNNRTDVIAGIVLFIAALLFFIFRPLVNEALSPAARIALIATAVFLILLYIFSKYVFPLISTIKIVSYFGYISDPSDRLLFNSTALKRRKFKLIFAYMFFLGHLAAFSVLIYLMLEYHHLYRDWFPFKLDAEARYTPALLILAAMTFSVSSLDRRLSGINHELAHKRYYIYRKRKRLMLELEEVQNKLEEEKKRLEELHEKNVQTAIELLKENGYQIVISPETRVEKK